MLTKDYLNTIKENVHSTAGKSLDILAVLQQLENNDYLTPIIETIDSVVAGEQQFLANGTNHDLGLFGRNESRTEESGQEKRQKQGRVCIPGAVQ